MIVVLAGGSVLSLLGRVSPLNPAVVAAAVAQALVLGFGRRVGERGRYIPGLLLLIAAYTLAEAREGRGVETPWLVFAIVALALLRIYLNLGPGSSPGEAPAGDLKSSWPWLARLGLPLFMILLGLYSGGSGSAGQMSPMFSWLPPALVGPIIFAVRKTIHSAFYSLLGCAILNQLGRVRKNPMANVPWALGLTAIFATFDEVRQAHIPARQGSAWDVLLDVTAAGIALVVVGWITTRRPAVGASQ